LDRAFKKAADWQPEICFAHNMQFLDVEERIVRTWPVAKMMHLYVGTCVSGQKAHTFPGVTPCTKHFGPGCALLYLPRRCGRWRISSLTSQYGLAIRQHELLSRYRTVIVPSAHMAVEYERHGIPRGTVHTVPLFAIDRAGEPHRAPVDGPIVFLGRLTAIKGAHVLIRAVAAASSRLGCSRKLIIAGEGPEVANLRSLAEALHVDATFPGWVDAAGRRDLLAGAALMAVPSLWPEPFGLTGLEGAAFGVPAVAFDVGGIPQWLTDGLNGRLVPPELGAWGLADAIVAILGNRDEHARLSAGAYRVATRLSIDAHMTRIEAILRSTALS
jgi:glycosyltransferase involved in cell wall biosynthesis